MNWDTLLKTRTNCFGFSQTPAGPKLIKRALTNLHLYMPSQNQTMPFRIDYFDMSNIELRKEIFNFTITPPRKNKRSLANPQVLAPDLLMFSYRGNVINGNPEIEIGLAAMFLAYEFTNMKLSYGYCACFPKDGQIQGQVVQLFMGVGHSSGDTYINPFDNKQYRTPPRKNMERRPSMKKYIKGLF